ncbi:hypothetical protein LWI29_008396 [Acer saccharum]|uniref:PGG domain-containing protein n=1 Tax=Acer saccharum TaxID=4024 RepID=A0AA39T0Y8_ACESA|nr:hypothetical protein LWI29_008396 [Acer saccharum]
MKLSKVNIGHYRPLIKAIQENDVKAQRAFLDKNPDAMKSEIDEFGSTVFHLIVDQRYFNSETVKLLKELVSKVLVDSPATLEILDVNGMTALNVAASAGNTKAVKVFVEKYRRLLTKAEEGLDLLPVHHAAKWGRKETVRYLLSVTNWTEEFALDSGPLLLKMLIESNLHDIPVKHDQDHVAWLPRDSEDEDLEIQGPTSSTNCSEEFPTHPQIASTIDIPAKDDQDHVAWPPRDSEDGDLEMQNPKYSTNCSEEFPTHPQIASTIDYIKRIHDHKLIHTQTSEIVRLMISEVNWTYKEASERLKEPVLTAARLGIHEFVNEVLKAYPNSGVFYDEKGQNIFLLAVLYRKEKVFSLIHKQVVSIRDYSNYIKDKEGRNILHLAGELVPSSQVPGAALQMQRELQWFKGIKEFFQPFLQEQRNKFDKTPGEVFTEKHKKLMEDGEKWMRDTATSCSVVAALIITIVFAAAFTIPGGINSDGMPNYLNETSFRIFAISVAIALFASTTSVQMFLGMLTSRYAEEDFLEALPRKLIIGLITLFMSSLSMMVAFGAAFCIAISHPWKWVIILICLLGCLPVTLYAWMQFPLLAEIYQGQQPRTHDQADPKQLQKTKRRTKTANTKQSTTKHKHKSLQPSQQDSREEPNKTRNRAPKRTRATRRTAAAEKTTQTQARQLQQTHGANHSSLSSEPLEPDFAGLSANELVFLELKMTDKPKRQNLFKRARTQDTRQKRPKTRPNKDSEKPTTPQSKDQNQSKNRGRII